MSLTVLVRVIGHARAIAHPPLKKIGINCLIMLITPLVTVIKFWASKSVFGQVNSVDPLARPTSTFRTFASQTEIIKPLLCLGPL